MLENVRVVLVGTSHSGNIGSAARAMKTMGITDLCLVAPEAEIDGKSVALSAGASDVLGGTTIVNELSEAVADCQLVIGASARSRTLDWPMLDGREAGVKLASEAQEAKVAIVFGRENSGLNNTELQQCHFHVCVPANPEYSSLNLAMAVQLLSYEVRMAFLDLQNIHPESPVEDYPHADDLERFYQHFEQSIADSGFIIKPHPGKVMEKVRRMFNRIRMEKQELNVMRGILTAYDKHISKPEK
ncbi:MULTISPECIES: tRNA (cytosine(32)/uridine(32)-2'-O)-methyltransferase TrmJ [unclassified Agarivorans]|uniref:tRNA (cytosine(32)/uridine(32)-2'-O)-methyltransferase TrmJ n=1 Tax=unclassified Agarivorans TaxID=2636026 RepID=UPI0010E91279|nr:MULTISPECIES: tRNA (cytosine(32)/uridine(32)-2'-O)-methyltransferase TrmJ [unclassified Agarivorans]MDO6687319.1 tRNA (cytosine(32)/uridine(32)-2'-O)-methyltransferase TrmJ [Agarivorans sp. 3_MG-2023]MDO6716977.1 tRNA (cytosine(32)/uridine(32)-2'-O)-methyltransferase TrmJ [Agarivorans sp. 2_MG-2023]GDY25633.1 tRNA (cytidine/uridine-2'-O-)-methyltransferase TrmJ [Agarivorans sp. Toyoura001]